MFSDVLNMFSGCSHFIKDTLVGLAGEPSASGGSCGSCVSFGYCGPGGPDESAWHMVGLVGLIGLTFAIPGCFLAI